VGFSPPKITGFLGVLGRIDKNLRLGSNRELIRGGPNTAKVAKKGDEGNPTSIKGQTATGEDKIKGIVQQGSCKLRTKDNRR